MISLIRAAWQEEMRVPMFVGLATDGYPDSDDPAMKNGARIYHMDTGKEYEYSADDDAWYSIPSGSGSGGLPSVIGSGKALVSIDGQWTEQEGYGYVESIFVPIKWDGNHEGKDKITVPESNLFYKISDEIFTVEELTGATITISDSSQEEYSEDEEVYIGYHTDGIVVCSTKTMGEVIISGSEGSYMYGLYSIPSDGTYFAVRYMSTLYVSALKSASTIHKFDSALIPSIGEVVDVGSNQYVYESYSLPAISADKLRTIYNNHKQDKSQVIKWTLLGSETYFNVVSADYITGTYSIDILVHNKYHCQYSFTDATTGNVNPDVLTSHELPIVTTDDNGKFLRVVNGVWAASTVPNAGGNNF